MVTIIKIPTSRWATRKNKKYLILVGLILVAALVAGGYYLWQQNDRAAEETRQREQQKTQEESQQRVSAGAVRISQASSSAQEKASSGDVAGAERDMMSVIDNPTATPEMKTSGYQMLALIISNTGDHKKALEYAQKSEATNPDRNSSVVLAMVYAAGGDKDSALKWYQTTLDRFTDVDHAEMPQLYRDYQDEMERLKQR